MAEELLTEEELARLWKVKKSTIATYRREHGLPFVRLRGGHIRFKPSDAEKWLADHQADAARVVDAQTDKGRRLAEKQETSRRKD